MKIEPQLQQLLQLEHLQVKMICRSHTCTNHSHIQMSKSMVSHFLITLDSDSQNDNHSLNTAEAVATTAVVCGVVCFFSVYLL